MRTSVFISLKYQNCCLLIGMFLCIGYWIISLKMFPLLLYTQKVVLIDSIQKETIGLMILRYGIMRKNGLYGYNLPDNDLYNLSMMITNRTIYHQKRDNPPRRQVVRDFHKYRLMAMEKFSKTPLARHIGNTHLTHDAVFDKGLCETNKMFDYTYNMNINYRLRQVEIEVSEKYFSGKKMILEPSYLAGIVHTNDIKAMCKTYLGRMVIKEETNRTYFIECPIYKSIIEVMVHASYIKMSTFRFECPEKDNYKLTNFMIENFVFRTGGKDEHIPPDFPECVSNVRVHRPGFWLRVNDVWHYAVRKCYFAFNISNTCYQCLKDKVNRIILMGDSHMKGNWKGLSNYFERKLRFYFTTSSVHLGDTINRIRDILPGDATLLLNSGAWDFSFLDLSSYITGMTYLFKVLRELKSSKPNINIIWFECVAFPYSTSIRRFRINSLIDGANQWVNKYMNELGVKIVHSYDISIPMEAFTQDDSHYYTLMGHEAKNKSVVNVGGVVTYLALRHMCTIYEKLNAKTNTKALNQ